MTTNKINRYVYEILEKVGSTKKKADKITILKQNDSAALRTVLQGCYHPEIKLDLPEGAPPYKACEEYNAPSNLMRKWKDFGYFTGSQTQRIGRVKMETMFIQLLEAIHPQDAKIVLQMKDKKPFKGISAAVVKEAFPTILP